MAQTGEPEHTNHLAAEKSPYLLQHAHNPVDWYPWGEEAFNEARREDKPIFLSIGYSTCHWCHVMEKESFEDEATAELLNRHFVSIKVDREERPDVDRIYMAAVQAMTGGGGWPLSVFLTPDLKPFFGGTYFPPEDRASLPAFRTVLQKIADTWRDKRADIAKAGAEMIEHLERAELAAETRVPVSRESVEKVERALAAHFDARHGGFGGAPKFPQAAALELLMRRCVATGNAHDLDMVRKTLDEMADGGIYDQIGGGFHRYAVDDRWLVPHFEKMLYDNALLARVYAEAHQLTGDPRYARIARETLDYLLLEMTSPEGGLYSAEDADSEGEEGRFYLWTPDQIEQVVGGEPARLAQLHYGASREGNFEGGLSVLHIAMPLKAAAREAGMSQQQAQESLDYARHALFAARSKRPRPHRDDKILASWNGLAISALSVGYQVLGSKRFLHAARAGARFVLKHLWSFGHYRRVPKTPRDEVLQARVAGRASSANSKTSLDSGGGLLRRYRDGQAAFPGYLDDYAYFVAGLIDLYESDFDPRWIGEALRLCGEMVERFWDEEEGGFFYSQAGDESILIRSREAHDGSLPSANAVAALSLLRLSEFTGDKVISGQAERTLRAFRESMERMPAAFAGMAAAADFFLEGAKQIVIAGQADAPDTNEMLAAVRRHFYPNKVVALADARIPQQAREQIRLIAGRRTIKGKATAYLCENFVCRRPTLEPSDLDAALTAGAQGT